ncbi:MAG: bifunctional (p)ppGpp synthetase/guanosine-3',5'-bis(diphosphate) 3'-pyrophosphohydrolase [Gammaproteobacteria bacterium]|nr:bifunctional (p)ppGpp synthetase/guanosine-3',5'-bis(diphosphate) 3'-pyrophosphohydrolase [Gammaproteobacteria bacterium]
MSKQAQSVDSTRSEVDAQNPVANQLQQLVADDKADAATLERSQEIAAILTELQVDSSLCTAAQLFPFVDSESLSKNQIRKQFGDDIALLTGELMKLHELGLPLDDSGAPVLSHNQAESLRRLLLAVVNDVRLVVVKIADQLARMRLAKNDAPELKQRLGHETRVIYAPLANKLGIWQLKWRLEDWAFRFLEPDTYQQIASQLEDRLADRKAYIAKVIDELEQELQAIHIDAEVSGRSKHIYSIWRKMQRKNCSFDELFDVYAVRILADSVADCYTALGAVHGRWRYIPSEFDDYVANPKPNNYQSIHTAIIGPDTKVVEVQIRTHEMHENSELGVAAHWQYKESGGSQPSSDQKFQERINWMRQLLQPDADASSADVLEQFQSDLFEDRVFVLTPRGDAMDLPAGSTALDFAYHVHTDLGHRCRGAKVNGKMVSLSQPLKTGDRVEVISTKSGEPSRDWLVPHYGYLNSTRARAKVRAWFRRQGNEYNLEQGHALMDRELARVGLKVTPNDDTARALDFDNLSEMFIAIGGGERHPSEVIEALQARAQPQPKSAPKKKKKKSSAPVGGSGISVSGVGKLEVHLAQCCTPKAPDAIQGYVSVGRGVTVHRYNCEQLKRMVDDAPDRLIDVHWQSGDGQALMINLQIKAYDRAQITNDISQTVIANHCQLRGITVHDADDEGISAIDVSVEVEGLDALSSLISRLQDIRNVVSVARR